MVSGEDRPPPRTVTGTQAGASLVGRFAAALQANAATCHGPYPADTAADLAVRLAAERSAGRPVAVAIGDALVTTLELPARLERIGARPLLPDDEGWAAEIASAGAGVTGAVRGLAATGTVAIACAARSPRTVSLLPRAHVCLLSATDLSTDLSAALASLTALPSALTWISGPSRSADLGMRITLGVHGPASLDVVVIAAGDSDHDRRARRTSATDQAWKGHPVAAWGGSPSAVSDTDPRPHSARWASRPARAPVVSSPTLVAASTQGPMSQGQTVPWW